VKKGQKNMFTTITTTIEDILNSKKGGNHHYCWGKVSCFGAFVLVAQIMMFPTK